MTRLRVALPVTIAITVAGAGILTTHGARASEAITGEEPIPKSVEEAPTPFERVFHRRIRERTLFPFLKDLLKELPPFFRDTEVEVHLRTYFWDEDRTDGSTRRAWAYGGSLGYHSGWLGETFQIGAELYTSQRALGKESEGGTQLLEPVQDPYTTLGQAFATLRRGDHKLTVYRQELDLPYVNRQDSRMTPNTFEAYTVRGEFQDLPGLERFGYTGGYIRKIKPRNSDDFISMSEAAGVSGPDEGMAFAGLLFQPCEALTFGAIDYFVEDVINLAYVEARLKHVLTDELEWDANVQFTHQRSVGSNRLTGDDFATQVVSLRSTLSYRGAGIWAAFSTTDDAQQIRDPWGSYPGHLSLMQLDFDRAGEEAWGIGLSYHFDRLGLEGLSAFAVYAHGFDALDPATGESLPNRREIDGTIDYRIEEGPFRGLWLRLRGSWIDVAGVDRDGTQLRVILNYDIPVL